MDRRTERDAAPLVARPRSVFETEPLPRVQRTERARPDGPNDDDAQGDFRSFNFHPALDDLPEESALTIEVNGKPLALLLCTPQATRELAVGWAFAQGYFDDAAGVRHIAERGDRVSLMVEDGTEGGHRWPAFVVSGFDGSMLRLPRDPRQIQASVAEDGLVPAGWSIPRGELLTTINKVFGRFRTERGLGGYHHAGAGDGGGVCIIARDVSRHNAVDKVTGWSLLHRVERSRLVLCLTGRVTADICYKAWRGGFPVIAASGLPTADAVDVAEAAGVTLVGRALDGRRSVYSHGWRLTHDDE
ncbi:MAG: formate dehydrogenase accessory sulfurtransferase FdhD [Thermomicrobiales bacterium]